MFRIIASHVDYDIEQSAYNLGSNVISETYIPVNEIESIVTDLKNFSSAAMMISFTSASSKW